LHSHDPIVNCLNDYGLKYILNCKESSHKCLYKLFNYNDVNTISYNANIDGFKEPKKHVISWLSGLPLHDNDETNNNNWFSLKILEAKKTKIEVKDGKESNNNKKNKKKFVTELKDLEFTFVTNLEINKHNVKSFTDIGRSRWKIENNNFNTLKNGGYKLEHNFGHGKNFLSSTLVVLNILAYLFHSVLYLIDENWRKEYDRIKNRVKFFNKLSSLLYYFIFSSFDELFACLNGSRSPPNINLITLQTENEELKKEILVLKKKMEENAIK
jgi:hypothetical protein